MSEMSFIKRVYLDRVADIARDLVNEHCDLIDLEKDEEGNDRPCGFRIEKLVDVSVKEMDYVDIIPLITISPYYLNKKESKKGVFIEDCVLMGLISFDKDDISLSIENTCEYFVEAHNDVLLKIIEDIRFEINNIAIEVYYETLEDSFKIN